MQSDANFTIIVATYNAEESIQECIDSFKSQTYLNKELIIIDGDSSDTTQAIIKKNRSIISYYLSEPDSGIYDAWNKALSKVQGNWVYFLGADDYFANANVLESVAKMLIEIPDSINVVYGMVDHVSTSGTYLYSRGEPWSKVGEKYKQLMTIPHQGVFHKKFLFDKHGGFDEDFRIAGDYEFLLRELKDNKAFFIPILISVMRQGGLSNDKLNSTLIIKELRRAQIKNNLKRPGIYWILAMIRVYLRLFLWMVLGENIARKLLDFGRFLMKKPPHWTKNI
jgi:glycosyltransferase involved in cell wall biosynthesis